MGSKFVIYCDMDGVLADFDQHYFDMFGVWPKESLDDNTFWAAINQHRMKQGMKGADSGWFNHLPVCKGANELWNFIKGYNHAILTATGIDRERAVLEKREWVNKYIPSSVTIFFVSNAREKSKYATATSILIDDRLKAIEPWKKAGGIGILHTSAEDTIQQLKRIMNNVESSKVTAVPNCS